MLNIENQNEKLNQTDPLEKNIESPGHLVAKTKIVLQTRLGQSVFMGKHNGSPGVPRFATHMLNVFRAAAQDDPYADRIQLKVEKELVSLKRKIKDLQIIYQSKLAEEEGVEISLVESVKPLKVPLTFGTPYGFQAAFLMRDYDKLVRFALTAKYLGIPCNKEPRTMLREIGDAIRKLFVIPEKWRLTGVNRNDIREENAMAKHAKELMGELHEQILNSKIKARYAPIVKQTPIKII